MKPGDPRFWNENADDWAAAVRSGAIQSRATTGPAIVREILKRHPKAVLDVGCGEGWLTGEMASNGIECTGIDGSERLIRLASSFYSGGRFEVASYEQVVHGRWTPSRKFDLAVFNFSLFEREVAPLLARVSSFLRPTGHLLIQTLHPIHLKAYRDGLLELDLGTCGNDSPGVSHWWARTLGSWMQVLKEAGLKVVEIKEPSDSSGETPMSIIFIAEVDSPLDAVQPSREVVK